MMRNCLHVYYCDTKTQSSYVLLLLKVYHVSAVGTVGYKSPEGSLYCIGNSLDTMPQLTTKADIFRCGDTNSVL